MSYLFKRLSDDNFCDLEYLFSEVYPGDETKLDLKNKFDTECFGIKHLGFLAYEESTNSVAAFYGVFPLPIRLGGNEVIAAQSGDTMTHPDHRGKGLFVSLAKATFELCKEMGVVFVFGYPNENSYPGFVKRLGWTHSYDMVGWNVIVPTFPVASALKRFGFGRFHRKIFTRLLKRVFDEVSYEDAVGLLFFETSEDSVIHDIRFLNYKLRDGFILKYKSTIIFVKVDDDIRIGLIAAPNGSEDVKGALRLLGVVCWFGGVVRIRSYFSPGGKMDKLLKNIGIRRGSTPFCYLKFAGDSDLVNFETVYVDYDTY